MAEEKRYKELGRALWIACCKGHLSLVQECIRAGADVNWKSVHWISSQPLHEACGHGDCPEVVEALLAAGADVNAIDDDGVTPLIRLVCCSLASYTAGLMTARLLLAANCDVNHEPSEGDTALFYAYRFSKGYVVPLLIEHGARVTPEGLCELLFYRSHNVTLSWLLEHGVDVNNRDTIGNTALHWAALKRYRPVFLLLLDHADVSIQNSSGRTALMDVSRDTIRDADIPMVRMLLERMNNVNKKLIDLQDVDGCTTLHLAARYNSWQVIHKLLNWGLNLLHQTGDTSSTALHLCVLCLQKELIHLSNL